MPLLQLYENVSHPVTDRSILAVAPPLQSTLTCEVVAVAGNVLTNRAISVPVHPFAPVTVTE